MNKIIETKENGWIVAKEITRQLGAWKWAKTRSVAIVGITHMNPDRYATDGRNPCFKVLWQSRSYTNDYAGGYWGYAGPMKDQKTELEKAVNKFS